MQTAIKSRSLKAGLYGAAAAIVTGAAPYAWNGSVPADPRLIGLDAALALIAGIGVTGALIEDNRQERRSFIASAAVGVYTTLALAAGWNDPPQKRNPADYDIANYSCPAGTNGPYQDRFYGPLGGGILESLPHCERGKWYWPEKVPALRR